VTTSGEYRHYYLRDGKRYSHTIDPRTARPVEHSLAAVVLIGSSSLAVDAWATALNVLGEVEGLQLAEQRGMAAMFMSVNEGKLSTAQTKAFAPYVITASP
jgi:thiamine biosynthesis lipoprotein